jgi:hypothetical protein
MHVSVRNSDKPFRPLHTVWRAIVCRARLSVCSEFPFWPLIKWFHTRDSLCLVFPVLRSETSVCFYRSARRYAPGDGSLHWGFIKALTPKRGGGGGCRDVFKSVSFHNVNQWQQGLVLPQFFIWSACAVSFLPCYGVNIFRTSAYLLLAVLLHVHFLHTFIFSLLYFNIHSKNIFVSYISSIDCNVKFKNLMLCICWTKHHIMKTHEGV